MFEEAKTVEEVRTEAKKEIDRLKANAIKKIAAMRGEQ